MTAETQVLVVGAGPTGLMLALELAHRGVAVRIVDTLDAPSPYSRALVVHARSLELFQNLGLETEFLAAGYRAIAVSGYVEGRHVADFGLGDIGAVATPFPFILFISQAETERILEQALVRRGVRVERSTTLAGFAQDDNGVTATLQRGDGSQETLRCAYLAGCDGAHSAVRHGLGLSFEGAAYEQDFALADVRLDWALPRDRLMIFFGRPGLLAVFPMPQGIHRLIMMVPKGFSDSRQALTLAETATLAQRLSKTELRLSEPVWLSRFHLHHRGVDRYGIGRAFVAGDAAHIHSPAGGQGMNTGIQDAANLAWKLALVIKRQATPRLLESYSTERWPIGQVLLKRTDRLFEIAATGNRWVVALRNLIIPRLMPLMGQHSPLRQRLFRFVSQLGVHYRKSPVVLELGEWRAGPRAGERAPDASLYRGHRAISLFEAMCGPEHHVLIFTGTRDGASMPLADSWEKRSKMAPFPCRVIVVGRNISGDSALSDSDGRAHALYGVPEAGGIYLIRPDGYVGARAPLIDAANMLAQYVRAI